MADVAPARIPALETLPTILERPRVPASFRGVVSFVAVLAAGYLLAEGLIFRSGFYTRFLEPDSTTGSFERAFQSELNRRPTGKKEVLIVGSSRLAEGFSAKIADEHKPEDGFRFFNCAVPSSGPRTFYYMIRGLDPNRNRYAAIAIPIDDYDDRDDLEDVANRVGDMRLVINRLRLIDIIPYAMSFTHWRARREVFRGTFLEGTTYQLDFQDLLEHTSYRLKRAQAFREHGDRWAYDYGGIDHNLTGITVDYAHHHINFPPGLSVETERLFEAIFFTKAEQSGRYRDFEVRWFLPIADWYRNSKTKLIFYETPRGPVPRPAPHLAWTAVDKLRQLPWVVVLDRHHFESLERPELFADHVHLSSDGRKIFSPMLADAIKENVH
ncbi:MAG TPA: hypothetical protein VGL72_18575 [Bryobacteraceae bacterium]